MSCCSLWVALLVLCAGCALGQVQVETEYGIVEGETIELVDLYHAGIEINTFLSIPFAKPPLGELRFLTPEEPDPWDDVFEAKSLGSACFQDPDSLILFTHPDWDDIDEDCLTLSIYAPADQSGAPYPVVVNMFGGAYQAGSNIQYPGHFLAAQDVVVVVPNYRLGIFGFAFSGDEWAPGNMGLFDQNQALKFVQENIAAFGGDPDLVTCAGQSAGASSCGQHIVSPKSQGLFHQAILASGSELSFWSFYAPSQEPENFLVQVAEQLDCPVDNTEVMVNCLRDQTADDLQSTEFNCSDGTLCRGFGPVLDRADGFLPANPGVIRLSGNFSQVPEMIGITQEDAFLYLVGFGPPMMEEGPNRTEFQNILRGFVDFYWDAIEEDRHEDVYQALDFYYSPWPHIHDRDRNRYQLGMLMTDISFGVTGDFQIKHHAQYAPAYAYVYNYKSDNGSVMPEWMGTFHSVDVPYIWGYPFLRHNPDVQEQTQIVDLIGWTEEDDEYSYYMEHLWTNFIKFGNPTPEPVQPPNELPPTSWPAVNTSGEYNYMYIGRDACEPREDYRQHEYAFWREYLTYLALGLGDGPPDGPGPGPPGLTEFEFPTFWPTPEHPGEMGDFLRNPKDAYMAKLRSLIESKRHS